MSALTWQQFVANVNVVIDAIGAPHELVDVGYVELDHPQDNEMHVELEKQTDGRYRLYVE